MLRAISLYTFCLISIACFGQTKFEQLVNDCKYNEAFIEVAKSPKTLEKKYNQAVLYLHFGALEKSKQTCYDIISQTNSNLLKAKSYQLLFDISYYLTDVESYKRLADSSYLYYKKTVGDNSIYEAQYNINVLRYYAYFRRSDLAEDYANKAMAICKRLPNETHKIDYPMVFAQYYASFRNDPVKAGIDSPLIYCNKALTWHNKIYDGVDNFSKVKLYHFKGLSYLDKNTHHAAQKHWAEGKKWLKLAKAEFDKANGIITKNIGNHHILLSYGNALIGLLHLQQKEYSDAIKYLDIAERNLSPTPYTQEFISPFNLNLMTIYDWKNNCYFNQYHETGNIEYLYSAIRTTRKAETAYEIMLLEGKHLNDYYSHIPYQKLANLYYELYNKTKKSTYLDSSFYYTEKEKIASIIIQKQLELKEKPANQSIIHQEIGFVENEILRHNKYQGEVEFVKLKPTNKENLASFQLISTVKEIQDKLIDDSTAIVMYSMYALPVGDVSMVLCHIITRKEYKHFSFEYKYQHQMKDTIDYMLKAIMSNDVNKFKNTSYFVYNSFFKPIEATIPKHIKKLQICPINRYRAFPFEALIQNKDAKSFAEQPYLLKKYAISYLISPSFTYNQVKHETDNKLLVFNPDFANSTLSELPFNKKCSEWIKSTFSNTKSASSTKSALIDGLQNNSTIHLATHAVGYDDLTNESRIYTSDTPLYLSEVYTLKLKSNPFVLLTCCEADKGNLQYNVGNDNFTRAFCYSGASAVLSTLWSIDDQVSAELMKHFYGNLAKGMDKSTALQQAKLAILSDNKLESVSPFFWAANVLTGDIDQVGLQEKSNSNLWIIALIACVSILILFYRKKLFFKFGK